MHGFSKLFACATITNVFKTSDCCGQRDYKRSKKHLVVEPIGIKKTTTAKNKSVNEKLKKIAYRLAVGGEFGIEDTTNKS